MNQNKTKKARATDSTDFGSVDLPAFESQLPQKSSASVQADGSKSGCVSY